MNYIHWYCSNSWLLCGCNIQFVHITADYLQLLGVFLEHPHPRKVALSSTRVLSMQGDALLWRNLAGRFHCLQFTRRRHAPHVTQPVVDCAMLACGSLDDYHHLIGSRASRELGTLTAALANAMPIVGNCLRSQLLGKFRCFVVVTTLLWAKVVPRALNLGISLTRTAAATSGEVSLLSQLGLLILPCYAHKSGAGRLDFACWVRFESGSRFGLVGAFLSWVCFLIYVFCLFLFVRSHCYEKL